MNRRTILWACLCALVFCLAGMGGCTGGRQNTAQAQNKRFTDEDVELPYAFQRSAVDEPYLTKLRADYKLSEVIAGKANDYEKVRAVSKWVRGRWEHNGSNEPQKSDPISILQEAAQGKRFRCVEYSVVLSGALNSVGVPARVLSLKTQDADTRESGAGHVVAEAYLADQKKWIMVDGQWDVIPTLEGQPLNAVELQQALEESKPGLSVDTFSGVKAGGYFDWVAPYLFYFGTKFDSRVGVATDPHELVLFPNGAKELTVFQRKHPMKDKVFTHSLRAFYSSPA